MQAEFTPNLKLLRACLLYNFDWFRTVDNSLSENAIYNVLFSIEQDKTERGNDYSYLSTLPLGSFYFFFV